MSGNDYRNDRTNVNDYRNTRMNVIRNEWDERSQYRNEHSNRIRDNYRRNVRMKGHERGYVRGSSRTRLHDSFEVPRDVNVINCNSCRKCYERPLTRRTSTLRTVPMQDYLTDSCQAHAEWRQIEKLNSINPCLNYVTIGLGSVVTSACADSGASISIISRRLLDKIPKGQYTYMLNDRFCIQGITGIKRMQFHRIRLDLNDKEKNELFNTVNTNRNRKQVVLNQDLTLGKDCKIKAYSLNLVKGDVYIHLVNYGKYAFLLQESELQLKDLFSNKQGLSRSKSYTPGMHQSYIAM